MTLKDIRDEISQLLGCHVRLCAFEFLYLLKTQTCLCLFSVGLKRCYTCDVCSVTLNSVAQYHAHLQGSKHQNK